MFAALALLTAACMPLGFLGTTPDDSQVPDDSDPTEEPVALSGLSWRLHETMGSLVYVAWDQDRDGAIHAEYSFDEGEWHSSPTWSLGPGRHERLLAGIPFAEEAVWRLVPEPGEAVDGDAIATGAAPAGLPKAQVDVAEPDRWLPEGRYLLTSINADTGGWTEGTYWTFILDRAGRAVWAQAAPHNHWTLFAQVSADRTHFLWDEATYWSDWDDGAQSTVHRTYLDAEIEQIATPGLHHAFLELPDHTLAWGSQYHDRGEALVLRGPDDADETVLWTCAEDWPDSGRNCESNCLFYSPERDSFLYSFYTNDTLLEIDRASGESLWWAGMVSGGYAFDPTDSQFFWQHGVSYTSEGHLLLSTQVRGEYTIYVREYEVDHDADALHEVWSYDPQVFASTNGDAWRLANGNTLHLLGSAGQINEVTPAGEVVWHVDFRGERLLGRGEFIEDLYTLVAPAP
jgi:hypothetical protein